MEKFILAVTKSILEEWGQGDAYLVGAAEELRTLSDDVLMSIESQAMALREWFREERKRMQKEALEAGDNAEQGEMKVGYAPINIFVKTRQDSLEIYWQEVHVMSVKSRARRYVYIPRGKGFKYSERKLRASAKPFELELVLETEQRAAKLREWWSIWSRIKRKARAVEAVEKTGSKTRHVASQEAAADAVPELVPNVVGTGA